MGTARDRVWATQILSQYGHSLVALWAPGVLLLELLHFHCLNVHWIKAHTLDVIVHWSGPADGMESLNKFSDSLLGFNTWKLQLSFQWETKWHNLESSPKIQFPSSSSNSVKSWICKRCYNIISWWYHPRHWQMAQRSQALLAGNHGTANSVC